MKTYKHKKTGDIVEERENEYNFKNLHSFPKNIVENSCDWEEIIEKEYEILKFSNGSSDFVKHFDGKFLDKSNLRYEEASLLQGNNVKITEIKRLSDGVILSIGDRVHLNNGNYFSSKITNFEFVTNGECGHLAKYRNKTFLKVGISCFIEKHSTLFYLEDSVKRYFLFTTEDGKDIFKNDTSYGVRLSDFSIFTTKHTDTTYHCSGFKEFSTLKSAQMFVKYNKLVFTYQDVLEIIKDSKILQSMVEKKLNNIV